jgi:uncharacterized SAM-binding protein YcdF (DUF218 family)
MKNKYILKIFMAFALLFTVSLIFSESLLTAISRNLVYEDRLIKAEAVVVLSGSISGNRIKAAVDLYHRGFAEKLVFSGFEFYPGSHSNALMKKYALSLGVAEQDIITEASDEEISTRGESLANLKLIKKHNIKRFILLTSAFHTKRAQRIYKETLDKSGIEMDFTVFPASDPLVPIESWWTLRTGQKQIFFEYVKLLAYFLG